MKMRFITDSHGKKLAVIVPIKTYQKMLEAIEDIEDVKLYNKAKENDTGERIPMEESFKIIGNKLNKKK